MIVTLRDHRQPLRTKEEAARQFIAWSKTASNAALLAEQSGDYEEAFKLQLRALEYSRRAAVLTDAVESKLLGEMAEIYRLGQKGFTNV
jgi:hypothetical protein